MSEYLKAAPKGWHEQSCIQSLSWSWPTSFGVTTTDIMTPSSSSLASGEGTKTGSEGYRPGCSQTFETVYTHESWVCWSLEAITFLCNLTFCWLNYFPCQQYGWKPLLLRWNGAAVEEYFCSWELNSPSSVSPGGPSLSVCLLQGVWSRSRRSSGRDECCTSHNWSEGTPDLHIDEGPPHGGPHGYRRSTQSKGNTVELMRQSWDNHQSTVEFIVMHSKTSFK